MAYQGYDWESKTRNAIIEGTRVLDRTSESLNRSHRVAIETEEIGNEVLSELGDQRESLLRTQDTVERMNDGISRSNRIISVMNRHVVYNRLLLICIIVLEALILSALIYLKLFKKK